MVLTYLLQLIIITFCVYRIYTVNNYFGIYVLQECIYYKYIQEHTNDREDLDEDLDEHCLMVTLQK